MSYDLALRRQIAGNIARDDARPDPGDVSIERGLLLPTALGLAAAAVSVSLVLAAGGPRRVRRRVEGAYYRATWRDLDRTQEMPAVSMRELVYGPEGDR